jgi:phosphoribosyl 1,2-cyclic phosphodiesterase
MRVTLRGTRGSLSSPGPDTVRYGGNTSCVEVIGDAGTALVLDAGTGIRQLSSLLPRNLKRIDILLTHLHMDHIQGLGFFGPLHNPAMAGPQT